MGKIEAIAQCYRITTLEEPTADILELLAPISFERVLEILLVMRMSPRKINAPLQFLRRAIAEGWAPDTLPEKVNRKVENHEERFYMSRGYSAEEARQKVLQNRYS